MADVSFAGTYTYSGREAPNDNATVQNADGSETVYYSTAGDYSDQLYYTVTITDSYNDVHVEEHFVGVDGFNNYYGYLTGYNNGGAYTVHITDRNFDFLFLSSPAGETGSVTLYPDERGGTFAPPAACYAQGTRILTSRSKVAIEHLVVGDLLVTASGASRPIRWLGHRPIDCRRQADPDSVLPIRIAAHAFAESRPARDLYVSPGHAICVDVLGEVLIPAGALVNGTTIRQVSVDFVTYWHVELDSHDVILAENLPAESYLDVGNRGCFVEAAVVDIAPAPDAAPSRRTHASFCRAFHAAGPLVQVVGARLHKHSIGPASTPRHEIGSRTGHLSA